MFRGSAMAGAKIEGVIGIDAIGDGGKTAGQCQFIQGGKQFVFAEVTTVGGVGTVCGLFLGYAVSFLAQGRIKLDQQVYSLSFVPFEPRWMDGVWVAAGAIAVSLLATLYPARSATRSAQEAERGRPRCRCARPRG